MGVGKLCSCYALFVRSVWVAVANVLHDGPCKEVHVLQDYSKGTPEVGFPYLVYVDAVVADLAVCDVVEAVDQVGYRGLPRSGGTHEGDLLARVCIEGYVVQDLLAGDVGEVHVVEYYAAFQLGVGERAISMGMFPGPNACTLGNLLQSAVLVLPCVDKRHIAVVVLRLFVHERNGKGNDYGIELVGHLGDWVYEIP